MFRSLLIANRGEIARRVIRSARSLGVHTIAVNSDADADALHVAEADESLTIGAAPTAESYANIERLAEAVARSGAEAVHPGYGFLSESPEFARRVSKVGAPWVGPTPATMEAVADKVSAREIVASAGVPVARGSEGAVEPASAPAVAEELGFPLMVKAAAGGGGMGMRVVTGPGELAEAVEAASRQASQFFGSGAVFLEQYLPNARHVEVQILGLADGRILPLGERDCSVQRRYQKVIEEAPAPRLPSAVRDALHAAAVRTGEAVNYRNAGTVEFLLSGDDFVFLEVNARLQVEHPVTELVTGLDLVADQLRVASDEVSTSEQTPITPRGHAIELRINAEDPRTFMPSPGPIHAWEEPTGEHIRVDTGYQAGDTVTPYYDALLAKLCAWAPDRSAAIDLALAAAKDFRIEGPKTNLPFLIEVLEDARMREGVHDTGLVASLRT